MCHANVISYAHLLACHSEGLTMSWSKAFLGGRVLVDRASQLPGDELILSVTLWRWEFRLQMPRVRIDPAQVPDPEQPGDLIDWSEARARRAGRG